MTQFSKTEVVKNLREKNKTLEDKIEAIKAWARKYLPDAKLFWVDELWTLLEEKK